MGVTVTPGTMPEGFTPICNECGICLCWDISIEDYERAREFWDRWKCESCNGGVRQHPPPPRNLTPAPEDAKQ